MRIACAVFAAFVSLNAAAGDAIDALLRMNPQRPATPEAQLDPPLDATLDVLAEYWMPAQSMDQVPPAVRERLMEALDRNDLLPMIVHLLPPRADVCARVKVVFEEESAELLDDWLVRNCASEHARLLDVVRDARDDDGGDVDAREAVEALAASSWSEAAPILENLATLGDPSTRTLALTLLFAHDASPSRRTTLQSIATDTTTTDLARTLAIDALARAAWPGRDEWLIGLMSDPSLAEVEAIESFVAGNPDAWIPLMIRLLDSPDRTTHDAAARALAQFQLEAGRADALRPLIPWIGDPSWATNDGAQRLRIVQTVASVGLREAIPGLVWAVEHDESEVIRAYAAEALAQFQDAGGNVAMRKALENEAAMTNDRMTIASALVKTGGLSAEEMARGLEATVASGDPPPMRFLATNVPTAVIVGDVVRHGFRDRDDVARLVLARIEELRVTNATLAADLTSELLEWDVPSVNAMLLARIEAGTADAAMIAAALSHRATLCESAGHAVRRLTAKRGTARGIGLVLAGAPRLVETDDLALLRALLAGARYVSDPLPVDRVAALFGRSPELDAAAESYLIADDSRAARAIVRQRHRGEFVIEGWPQRFEGDDDGVDAWERELVARFHASGAAEMFALVQFSTASPPQTQVEIAIDGEDAGLRDFLGFLEATDFDDLPHLDTGTDGTQFEYVHLTRDGGRRVFMSNPWRASGSPYDELVRRLEELANVRVR